MGHVDEGEAEVGLGLEVDWKVEIVVVSREVLVNEAQEITLGQNVRNVFDH